MAYARKVPVKTDHVPCFGDFAEYIWNTFTRLLDNSKWIDTGTLPWRLCCW